MEKLVNTYRSELLDLFTTGSIAVVDLHNNLLYYAGNPDKVSYARSSAKLMQAMVPVACGATKEYNYTEQEIAQICASHSGEEIHVNTVRSILKKIGLDESYLQCGPHYPFKEDVAQNMKDNGIKPLDIHNNCSGKHTGMLTTVKYMNEDLDTYYKTEHPHQKRIIDMIGRICNYDPKKIIIGLDGCGVPVHAMPLRTFAYGMARMGDPSTLDKDLQESAKTVINAVMKYPLNTSGSDRIDYKIISKYPGKVVVKSGANGYFAGCLPDRGIGFAIKTNDGLSKMRNVALIELLHQIGLIPEEDLAYFDAEYKPKDYNHKGEFVGSSEACFKLKTV
ncbi:asparaginase [Sedimentibacter sp. zth1]|uniref:asparaginase n=1 Tax=Sedimentibacter sp. zth1 TaxID=2816908 RepID=UPI001A9131BC|nr:asparaginase [Sedimentibacter sp. zth1]QSX06760.1 asparaginase [Sedimentibacter sp. zth1]